jgi:hypothetical protein
MDLMRLAFKYAPEESKIIMTRITDCDKKINELTRTLANEK